MRERSLPVHKQILIVAGLGVVVFLAVAALFLGDTILGHGGAAAQPVQSKLSRFIPARDQLAALSIQAVPLRVFHTEIITDGYIAPNGGFSVPGTTPAQQVQNESPVLSSQTSDVLQAESDLAIAKGQFQLAQENESRQHALYSTDGAALKDWQQSQADLATAAAALTSARNRLRIFGKSDREIAMFERQKPGGNAANAIFSVGSGARVWLIANVREEDAPLVRPGDEIEAKITGFPQQTFRAKIDYISPVIDASTHRLVVGAAFANADGALRPNMSATVTISGGPATSAPAVPSKAIIYEGDAARVWVAGGDGSLALRDISLGRTNGDLLEVTKGLSGGERIVTGGALFIDRAATGG